MSEERSGEHKHVNGVSESVTDAVFRRLRQDIILGILPPGSKIKLEKARERYSISISSLREILCRLSAENLVLAEGQRGFEVSPVSRQELTELADLRIVLECHAIGLSFAAGDLEWEGSIVAAHHRLAAVERRLLAGDVARTIDWVQCDWEFHKAIVAASNSTTLLQNLSSVFDRFLRYHMLAGSFRGNAVVDDHKLLFERALARDADGAKQIIKGHIQKGVDHILKEPHFLLRTS
ncbi:GntR family transcriptional regulator [Agrobacterium tumefaciens]|uniref:GntR family transcriptional regulator n=1 Tax=Agrobacterium tumefaciens TaxID=358 RepID=UPI00287BCB30|nr:GntR family transcriptional regulator [Agrobacterium tumefaciens]MDS7594372.1 GntR family transcriptional regulator [Agrobacterium tumefaciens]